jgi:hypothetical protein
MYYGQDVLRNVLKLSHTSAHEVTVKEKCVFSLSGKPVIELNH